MTNALALKMFSLKAAKKVEGKRSLRLVEPLQKVEDKYIMRKMNTRFKRPYAKKGWWWSGLWDPSAKSRSINEKIEILFEKMSKKTYEEIKTSAKHEEAENEYRFQIHTHNKDIEISIQQLAHTSEVTLSKEKSSKKYTGGTQTTKNDNSITLVSYMPEKINKKSDCISEPNSNTAFQTDFVGTYLIKIKTRNTGIRSTDSSVDHTTTNQNPEIYTPKVETQKTVMTESEPTIVCDIGDVPKIIVSLIDQVAKQIESSSKKPVELSIGTGIVPNLVEIFVEEATTPAIISQTAQQNQNRRQTPVHNNTQAHNATETVSQYIIMKNKTDTKTEPKMEELTVTPTSITTAKQPVKDTVLFFQSIQQTNAEVKELPIIVNPKIEAQETKVPENIRVVTDMISIFPENIMTRPLAETIFSEHPGIQQKNPDVSYPKKDSGITVFFYRKNANRRLKQTDAEASPEE